MPVNRNFGICSVLSSLLFSVVCWTACLALTLPACAEEPSDPPAAAETPSSAQLWVSALESNDYDVREQAAQELIQFGAEALAPLETAIGRGRPESVVRGMRVLSQLARSEDQDLANQAVATLQRLAQLPAGIVGGYAERALDDWTLFRRDRAIVRLEQLGARRLRLQMIGPLNFPVPLQVIEFDSEWNGTPADLAELRWLNDIQIVSFHGPDVRDSWLEPLRHLDQIQGVKLYHTPISHRGMEHLAAVRSLRQLVVMYVPIDGRAVESIRQMESLEHLVLFGTRIQADEVEQLAEQSHFTLDHRSGAFLGIRFLDDFGVPQGTAKGCRVDEVHRGGPAERAGLLAGDRIIKIDDTQVTESSQLIQLIGSKQAGQRVQVTILRGDEEPKVLPLTMGEWP